MNKLVLASVSAFVLALAVPNFADAATETSKTEHAAGHEMKDKSAHDKKGNECPPKKKKKAHKKGHKKAHKQGEKHLWVNAEAPCVNPCGSPTCTTCAPTCEPAPCAPAPAPTCAPAPAPTCEPAPACAPLPATCVPQQYCGNPGCPYAYWNGYFYYPNAQGTLLPGYVPAYMNGAYWYASVQHPHAVYVENAPVLYVMPHGMNTPHAAHVKKHHKGHKAKVVHAQGHVQMQKAQKKAQ